MILQFVIPSCQNYYTKIGWISVISTDTYELFLIDYQEWLVLCHKRGYPILTHFHHRYPNQTHQS